MKAIIVAPQYRPIGQYYEQPVGLAYISASLKAKGYNVTLINENEERIYQPDYDRYFAQQVSRANILLTGGLSVHYGQVKAIIENARRINPEIKIIAGGGLISSEPELMTDDLNLDHAIIGEGEEATCELFAGTQTTRIIKASAIKDLDLLQFPDYDGLRVSDYLSRQVTGDEHYSYPLDKPRCLPMISSRGCTHFCSFCFHPIGPKYRKRSIENIAAEIELHKIKYNINILTILDELISDSPERLAEMCTMLKRFDIKWMCQARVSGITREMMQMMKDAGCFQVSFGIEHVNDCILAGMKKHITRSDIEKTLALAYEFGIGIQGNILFGCPGETGETIKEALEWWRVNIKYGVNLTNVIPFPGSKLYLDYIADKTIPDSIDYIKRGCPFIPKHFTSPETGEIRKYLNQYNHLPAEVIEKNPTTVCQYRGQMYNVTAKCFHCGHVNKYVNLYKGATGSNFLQGRGYRIGCRNCNGRIDFTL